jgi:hypothetical protein
MLRCLAGQEVAYDETNIIKKGPVISKRFLDSADKGREAFQQYQLNMKWVNYNLSQ